MTAVEELLVRAADVTRTYGRGASAVTAVHDANVSVRPGDEVAITGPSGSGKSTLLHMLAGLELPTAGTLTWPALPSAPASRRSQIGVVFQAPSLLTPLDVAENVELPLLIAGVPDGDARARALAALEAVGIASLAGALPEELSGGQAQRVAVARVLAIRPPLILADEPTGQLDSAHAGQVIDVLLDVARSLNAGLVVATHDETIAARLAIRWRMTDGRVHSPSAAAR